MKSPPKGVPPASHKGLRSEELGNITGSRTDGITTVGGGDQLAHSLNHYGKDSPQIMGDPWGIGSVPRARWSGPRRGRLS
jgi:hypothetical protein